MKKMIVMTLLTGTMLALVPKGPPLPPVPGPTKDPKPCRLVTPYRCMPLPPVSGHPKG